MALRRRNFILAVISSVAAAAAVAPPTLAQAPAPAGGATVQTIDPGFYRRHLGPPDARFAHYYDPNKAAFQDFEPFWEFVSGPIHAGTFGPNTLDNTFGPQLMYIKAPTKEQGQNLSPALGLQFFGLVAIDGATEVMTVTLKDTEDRPLWSTKLEPKFV